MTKRQLRTLDEVAVEYFQERPEEIDAYIEEVFQDYAQTRDSAALLASLRVIAKVRGISTIAKEIGVTRQGLQKALSSKGNPRFENITAIMNAFGYQLMPQKIENPITL